MIATPGPVELGDAQLADAVAAHSAPYNHGRMNCGKGSAVIYRLADTSDHQAALAAAAATARPDRHAWDQQVPAVLIPAADGAVRVLIDGMPVGQLFRGAAAVVQPLLNELAAHGQQLLVASALIVGGTGATPYGVRLQVRPGPGTRWATGTKPADIT